MPNVRISYRILADFYAGNTQPRKPEDSPPPNKEGTLRTKCVRIRSDNANRLTDPKNPPCLLACPPEMGLAARLRPLHCWFEPLLPAAAPCVDVAAAAAAADSYKNNDVTDQSPVHDELGLETHVPSCI